MIAACTCQVYARYKFPACADLVFRTDLISKSLTLVLFHKHLGEITISKTTDSEGKFTLLLSDLPKPYLLNPWIGVFNLWFIYEGSRYDLFLTDQGEYTGIEIEAVNYAFPPATYTFESFFLDLATETVEPPEGEGIGFYALNQTFILQ